MVIIAIRRRGWHSTHPKKALHFGYAVDYLHFVITGITVVVVAVPEVKRRCKLTLTLESPLLSNFDCEKS